MYPEVELLIILLSRCHTTFPRLLNYDTLTAQLKKQEARKWVSQYINHTNLRKEALSSVQLRGLKSVTSKANVSAGFRLFS